MIEVGSFGTRSAAEHARALLAAAKIPAVLVADDSGGDPLDPSQGARLFVAEADARYAAAILSDHACARDE